MFSINLQEKGEKNMLENLKKEMDRQGVKVKDIANLLGLKSPAVSKRIYGTVQLQESEKYEIAKFLNVKKSEFLFRNTGYSPSKKEYSKTTFSERFSMLLEKDGRTQKEISKLLNVNERTISDWKNGKQNTNLEMLKRISNTLGVSFAYLSGESDFYPNTVNYLDESLHKYRERTNDIKEAVNAYLMHINFDIRKLNAIVDNDPFFDHEKSFYAFFKEHRDQYEEIDKLKEEIKEYEKKRANELGFNIDFDSIDDFTEDEEKFFSLIDKEDYLNEKYKEIEKLEIKLHEEHEKSFDKKHEQAERIKEFYNELPDKILTIVENELSDIIDEYHIFDEKSRIKHNYNFRISYLEKSLFELEVLHDDIKNMDTDEYSSSIKSIAPFSETPIYEFKHRFGLRLHKYKEAIKERDAVLICLNEDITELKKNINDLKINLNKK